MDPPAVLNFILTELGVDLNQILDQFNQLSAKIMNIRKQVQIKVAAFFDINSFFAPIEKIWDTVSNEISSLRSTFAAITNRMAEGLRFARPITYTAIFGPIVIFILIFLAYSVIYVRFILEAKKAKLFYSGKAATTFLSEVNLCVLELASAV